MRLNGNQLRALAEIADDGDGNWFHFDFAGTDPLDKRIVNIKVWSWDYKDVRVVVLTR